MRRLQIAIGFALLCRSAFACQPARLDIALASQDAAVSVPLSVNIQIKDESGRACPADHDYPIHLAAFDSRNQSLRITPANLTIPRFATFSVSTVTAPSAGLIRVQASGPNLRVGLASVFVRPVPALPRPRAQTSWLLPAAYVPAQYVKVSNEVTVVAHCAEGGAVSANGKDSVVIHADLENGPAPFDVTLHFAKGSLDWDGTIKIPAGQFDSGVEIRSTSVGPVDLSNLLDSTPAVRLDPSGAQSCQGVEFISPAQFADLEFETGQISFGEPVRLSVIFRDREYNRVPVDDPGRASVQVLEGRQPSFTAPQIDKDGAATLICKPNWWGGYRFRLLDASVKTVYHGQGDTWTEGPVGLNVTFPWIPFWSCVTFGSLGAILLALYRRESGPKDIATRVALGVGSAVLLVTLTLQASLLKPDFTPYTLMIIPLCLVAGWTGPAAFNWYARKLDLEPAAAPGPGRANRASAGAKQE